MTTPYPIESLDSGDDDGTMPENVAALSESVVGRKIVSVEPNVSIKSGYFTSTATILTLDNGKQVVIENTDDCCAFTELESVILHLDKIDHVITGVGTTDGYESWHIYADLGDVVEMKVGWSSGNPFYYGYGFNISVRDIATEEQAK